MSKKVAVVLAGCGVFDGAEIHESVLTLLRLDQLDAEVTCLAPNVEQMHVVNHLSGEPVEGATRNVLEEAARIARGDIQDIASANAADFDAVIVPGGFGAAKNLCTFAVDGPEMAVNPDFSAFVQSAKSVGKTIGLMCIAPAMSAKLLGAGVCCTIGNDADTAAAVEKTGARHENCAVDAIVYDEANKLVSTPAYMLAGSISEAAKGINALVDKVIEIS
ncbi:isoprenoid biosynthesis glyoxalase ElbB [Pseudoteredinibacter isoporae]|uniref:Glyoxalase n=1 Tax=Pseudoteredinibacter isoporae TaxID=570281 RepID=A0A7X0JQH8_9GAMM|nr:isoprenoid biosynthesis glyoxalase ElbB [Pseudoteredinibacter isoporae]MBB6520437.1 enhancing lycopene biosynthesis protein 2 [Pseudoteredinibacter isoporae]NHO86005.1 isoprenoid biosynthesis glyoxalase ElbB [Pseudoteredinibacter isoporae]NIB25544.1 isoprenoid biosynthesis glyoxalase ElbB [Pseudoteredinibacter isoporae]